MTTISRIPRRRGAFGLDERRWPDPARVEEALLRFIDVRLPEALALTGRPAGPDAGDDGSGRTLALLLPRGRVAVLRIERDPARPGPACRALAARCDAMGIPHAVVSRLDDGRAALRRLGLEPPDRAIAGPTIASVFGRG